LKTNKNQVEMKRLYFV